jgi:hypothetical protein
LIPTAEQDGVWAVDKLALLLDGIGTADLCFGCSWLINVEGANLAATSPPACRPFMAAND